MAISETRVRPPEFIEAAGKTYLSDLGIPTMIYYPIPIHKQKPYKNDQILENTDKLSDEVISLPIHTELESSNQDFIIDKITKYFK